MYVIVFCRRREKRHLESSSMLVFGAVRAESSIRGGWAIDTIMVYLASTMVVHVEWRLNCNPEVYSNRYLKMYKLLCRLHMLRLIETF